jgi:predicted ArsR family transcriptional regulator
MIDREPADKVMTALDPARRPIADALRTRPGGFWTVDEIASRQGIHRTVAFDHLEALVAAGFATKVRVRGGRGRPANAYRYSGATVELSYPPRRSRMLAEILARAASGGVSPREVARAAGASERLDGGYDVVGGTVHARTCMFGPVCDQARELVCGIHAGFVEGALEAAGRRCNVAAVGPDGSGGCRFHLS